ncbi:MAG: DUF4835 family protein [Flavobacteriales bacterium]
MNRIVLTVISVLITFQLATAQELRCNVQVLSPQIQLSDKRIFTTLETAIREFMNNTRWTTDNFERDERIECNMTFNITGYTQPDDFRGTLTVQSRRPVFNTSYGSMLFNHMDNDIQFKYLEFQPLEFNENVFVSNLTAILGYYAYLVLGLDYDTFSLEGGSPFFQKAQQVVNSAQGASERGWKPTEMPPRNRYWYIENLLNPIFKPMRECNYRYHRLGLDVMYNKIDQGRAAVLEGMQLLMQVHKVRPSSFNMQLFFNAKADELANMFSQATPEQKTKIMEILNELDPTNGKKYQKINK